MSAPSCRVQAGILGNGQGIGVLNNNPATFDLDTLINDRRAEYVTLDVVTATVDSTAHAPLLKLSHGETTFLSDHTNCAWLGLGGVDIVDSTANTCIYRFNVDCRTKSRYLKLVATTQTTQEIVVLANLFRLGQEPSTVAADYGSQVQNLIFA
jgi:hypothetical protein